MKTIILLGALLPLLSCSPLPMPTPPNIPTAETAKTQLAELAVKPHTSQEGYSRKLFPHWITQSGTCNTRETVLKRDGTDVTVNSACASVDGTWESPYDGAIWTDASDIDIDHLVPLSNAWKVRQPQEPSLNRIDIHV